MTRIDDPTSAALPEQSAAADAAATPNADAQPAQALTPTVRGSIRRWRFWIILAAAIVVITIVSLLISGASRPLGVPLDPRSPGLAGTKALVEVLGSEGVDVTLTGTLEDTESAVRAGTTVVLHDRAGILDDSRLREVARMADHLVVLAPDYHQLATLAPQLSLAGAVEGVLPASCNIPAAERADRILGDGTGMRHFTDDGDASTCFISESDIASLAQVNRNGTTITFVGATDALTNEHITRYGNAALALGLLGEHPNLVWYEPSGTDAGTVTIGDLSPEWITPVAVLLLLVTVAAGVAQGRRMGPLVTENLPVTVPAAETMEGRARLYARSSARLRAIDALRVGTIRRIANRARLPYTATVAEIADTVATLTGHPQQHVRAVLFDTVPTNDQQLVQLSDQLRQLELDTERAARP